MLPLTLITGFLGSGKTTLLREIIAQHRSRRLVFLVNEFGAVDIDGQLLELPADQLVSIPGGSIFCRCLTGEFIRVLKDVDAEAVEGVVVEASGIADPKVIGQMLAETQLNRRYELRQIITVIDPGSFMKLMHTLPNIIAQVEAADLAIINKTDLYGNEQLDATERHVRQINSAIRVARAQRCRIEIEAIDFVTTGRDKPSRLLAGGYAACTDPNYITKAVSFAKPVDMSTFVDILKVMQPNVYRIKGFVPTGDGTMYVDVSASGVVCRPADNPSVRHELVLIAGPKAWADIEASVKRLWPTL